MSQHDFDISNQSFPATRSDLNNALKALASSSSGASAPSTTYSNQLWFDTTNNLLKFRNSDNDAWVTLAYVDPTNDEWEIRSAVIQAVDSAGIVLKTDDGIARITVNDNGNITIANDLTVSGEIYTSDIRATGSDGVEIKTDDGVVRLKVDDNGDVVFATDKLTFDLSTLSLLLNTTSAAAMDGVKGYLAHDSVSAGYGLSNASKAFLAYITGTSYKIYDSTLNLDRFEIDTSGNLGFDSGYGSVATAYGCRAWVSFTGTGTVTIRDSGNVSSVTDNGTGQYTINFTTAMPDANYSAVYGNQEHAGAAAFVSGSYAGAYSTTQLKLSCWNYMGSAVDLPIVNVAILR